MTVGRPFNPSAVDGQEHRRIAGASCRRPFDPYGISQTIAAWVPGHLTSGCK
jgi:hypothetical protein